MSAIDLAYDDDDDDTDINLFHKNNVKFVTVKQWQENTMITLFSSGFFFSLQLNKLNGPFVLAIIVTVPKIAAHELVSVPNHSAKPEAIPFV